MPNIKQVQELERDTLLKLIASKEILQLPVVQIMEELKLNKHEFYRLKKSPEYKAVLREISDEATGNAVSVWKSSMTGLIHEAHRALREQLADNNLEAVKIVLKSIGMDAQEKAQGDTSITVVLPQLEKQEKAIEVIDDSANY